MVRVVSPLFPFAPVVSPSFINSALKNEMENTIANIRILDVVRLVHGYFIFVFLIINMLS